MADDSMKLLVQHLKEYKDSTAAEIHYLNSKIQALKEQNDVMIEEVEEREIQLKEHDNIIRNLQSANNRKYRAEERSDWQSLVESLNEDRDYLNRDLSDIQSATQQYEEQTALVNKEIDDVRKEIAELTSELTNLEADAGTPSPEDAESTEDRTPGTPTRSNSNGDVLPTPSQTRYKSLIQQHKENHELHTRLLQERQASQDEDARIQENVRKQREELHALRTENQQLHLALNRLGGGLTSNVDAGDAHGSVSGGVGSQFRKLFRLCGRPDDHPIVIAQNSTPLTPVSPEPESSPESSPLSAQGTTP